MSDDKEKVVKTMKSAAEMLKKDEVKKFVEKRADWRKEYKEAEGFTGWFKKKTIEAKSNFDFPAKSVLGVVRRTAQVGLGGTLMLDGVGRAFQMKNSTDAEGKPESFSAWNAGAGIVEAGTGAWLTLNALCGGGKAKLGIHSQPTVSK